MSEALEAVSRMIRGYANSGQAGKSYLGAMAELLMHYPRRVALACADPIRGVARETKFLPTTADVVAWCEREADKLHQEATREDRIADQLKARAEWQNEKPTEKLKEMGQAWLDRTDPAAQALATNDHAEHQKRQRMNADADRVARTFFERECREAGIDPAKGVSPSLLKLVGEQNVTDR